MTLHMLKAETMTLHMLKAETMTLHMLKAETLSGKKHYVNGADEEEVAFEAIYP